MLQIPTRLSTSRRAIRGFGRRLRHGRTDRRSIQSVSPRARYRREFRAAGVAGRHRWLSRQRLPFDASGIAAVLQEALDLGIIALCGRSRRPHGRASARRRCRHVQAGLQLSAAPCRRWTAATLPDPAAPRSCTRVAGHFASFDAGAAVRSMQLLHHHQRARPQVALSHAPTTSKRSCVPMRRRASPASSSPTTILRATRTGKRSSIA